MYDATNEKHYTNGKKAYKNNNDSSTHCIFVLRSFRLLSMYDAKRANNIIQTIKAINKKQNKKNNNSSTYCIFVRSNLSFFSYSLNARRNDGGCRLIATRRRLISAAAAAAACLAALWCRDNRFDNDAVAAAAAADAAAVVFAAPRDSKLLVCENMYVSVDLRECECECE
jgi:hypothetical protein